MAISGEPPAPQPPRRRAERLAARERRHGRRRLAVLGILGALAFVLGAVAGRNGDPGDGEPPAAEPERAELPRGGTSLLPEHRLVGFYGAPQSEELGALGVGSPAEASRRLLDQARAYRGDKPVLPVLELIATVAASDPGEDGLYRLRQPHSVIRTYLEEARRRRALLVLDVQPGAAEFADEVARLRRWLRQPDVGLALDPEWHVDEGEVPGQVIGSVDAATVNEISAELARLVRSRRLPEKLFVVHQFTDGMIAGRDELRERPGLATVLNSDGFGDPVNKIAKYRELRPPRDSPFAPGFKLFYREDLGLMEPADVLGLRPTPDLIVYE